jgi:hypothetical protein
MFIFVVEKVIESFSERNEYDIVHSVSGSDEFTAEAKAYCWLELNKNSDTNYDVRQLPTSASDWS